jgi:hypothetical protein
LYPAEVWQVAQFAGTSAGSSSFQWLKASASAWLCGEFAHSSSYGTTSTTGSGAAGHSGQVGQASAVGQGTAVGSGAEGASVVAEVQAAKANNKIAATIKIILVFICILRFEYL